MKKSFIGILLLLFSPVVFAQDTDLYWYMLGIINDSDGYTNVREDAAVSSPIQDKVYNNQVFYIPDHEGPQNNMLEVWYNVNYEKAKKGYCTSDITSSGYIHNSRALPLAKLNRLSKRNLYGNSLTLSNDNTSVVFTKEPFNESKHTIERDTDGWLEAIDGQKPWGVDGCIPTTGLASITINYKDKTYSLPEVAISNIYEPSFLEGHCGVFVGSDNTLYIAMVNGDGAGSYIVIWAIADKELKSMNLIIPF